MKSDTASSINAIPESDCTGPSCKKSAMRRRSSCSDASACSVSSRRPGPSGASAMPLVDDRFAQRDRDGVCTRVGFELRENVAHVALHGLLADEELGCDVGVRHAVGEQLE